jgi:hypothetical protein
MDQDFCSDCDKDVSGKIRCALRLGRQEESSERSSRQHLFGVSCAEAHRAPTSLGSLPDLW